MDQPAETFSWKTIRTLFSPREDPYAGVFLDEPRRIGGVMLLALALVLIPLEAVAPPTERIGGAGWAIAVPIELANLTLAYLLLRRGSRVGFNGLLAITYFVIAQVAAYEWLVDEIDTPYQLLFLGPAILPPSIHPPRRALILLAVATLALFAPLAYQGWNADAATEKALQAAFMWGLALITMAVTNAVREQRLVLLSEEQAANRLARRDQLTGLPNRRAFDEMLEHEIARSRRSGSPISVLILDLDGFKSINDRFGHLAGDQALKAVAGAIGDTTRVPDTSFRWGGDEFALVLPDTSRAGAVEVGERLRAAIGGCSRPGGEGPIGICLGVAELGSEQSADALLAEADAELRQEKLRPRAGSPRDRTRARRGA